MSGLDTWLELGGSWTGRNQVLLPGEPPHESPTSASITPIVAGKFVQLAYTWAFDGVAQEGVLILGHEPANDMTTVVWIDSWHMGNAFMLCRGRVDANGTLDVRGTYPVDGGPDWGWRIVVESAKSALRIQMYNIDPEGGEFLGVEAAYTRIS